MGGGGGPGLTARNQPGQRFLFAVFLVLSLFYHLQRGPMVLLHRELYFPKDPEGVQMLISIESHITCDFPGGGGGVWTTYLPLWILT